MLSGGREIGGWKESKVNDRPCWVVDLPEVREGNWLFHQLWVDGKRGIRARHPNEGLLSIESVAGADAKADVFKGQDRFVFAPGDFRARQNLEDVDVIVLHYWLSERMAVRGLDEMRRTVRFVRSSSMRLMEGYGDGSPRARYSIENARELLDAAGEWYLDRKAGQLFYQPQSGESITTSRSIAPVLPHLLRLEGQPEAGRFVEHVTFRGLMFAHSEWWPA